MSRNSSDSMSLAAPVPDSVAAKGTLSPIRIVHLSPRTTSPKLNVPNKQPATASVTANGGLTRLEAVKDTLSPTRMGAAGHQQISVAVIASSHTPNKQATTVEAIR